MPEMGFHERKNRNREGREFGGMFVAFGAPIGFIFGFFSCAYSVSNGNGFTFESPFVYSFLFAICGFLIGFVIGFNRK